MIDARGVFAAVAATTLLVGHARAQTDCDSSVGADVIVGELVGVTNYSSSGGIEAFSIGTTSCNIGDEELLWISNSNQHPVIGQNLFRMKDGRFEQIGQAWLKHGFTALQQDACGCGCISSGTGTRLGVGCSDPYSAGLNGQQNGMGPKFEVNAATGFFEWTPTDFSTTGNSIYKRLQAKISDLDPAQDGGGSYFVEGQYIAPDDTAAGNGHNNVSYRGASITGSGSSWSMSLTGSTQRELPAIEAWKAADPSVNLVSVTIPDDGIVYLGWKAVALGGGEWDYEFAVYNMTSDRSIGSFTVPFPIGTVVTSTGFHDVDYHSGEPFVDNDWPDTVLPDEVNWATEVHGTNANANAIRWGTLYNFRFTAVVDPADLTDVSLGLFKPGAVDSITISLDPAAPSNDSCVLAVSASTGDNAFSTLGATSSGPVESGCDPEADVWYSYVVPCSGTVTISLCGSSFDTRLAVYVGACPTLPDSAIACDDDFCGTSSEVTVDASAGDVLVIRIGGAPGETGTGTLAITCNQEPTGACCLIDGCIEATAGACALQSGDYQGDFSSCAGAIVLANDFESGTAGWSVENTSLSTGAWEAADPNSTTYNGSTAAPGSDATPGSGNVIAFVTQNGAAGGGPGDADVDGGPTDLVSPAFDLLGTDGRVTYARWFFSDNGVTDQMTVWVSNDDGNSWVEVTSQATAGSSTAAAPSRGRAASATVHAN
ncbi:MAG: hypothetical protein ACYTF9_08790 [Planctomycetota bacterium]|jgi:hypothetical protein